MMKRKFIIFIFIICAGLLWQLPADAHFGGIIPSDNIITQKDDRNITVSARFFHPMEGDYMEMARPVRFGVMYMGKEIDLRDILRQKKIQGFSTWEAEYKINRPGDYTFYLEPEPYWEPAEDCYIIHYTKACVNALGLEEGWDKEVGLETEIIPLVRPYGLWTGNLFRGIVKVNGRPAPYAKVEVEYYNEDGKITPSSNPYITQVTKADGNGVFAYCMPRAGWWAFAALSEASRTLKGPGGDDKPIEIGAVYWVKVKDMR